MFAESELVCCECAPLSYQAGKQNQLQLARIASRTPSLCTHRAAEAAAGTKTARKLMHWVCVTLLAAREALHKKMAVGTPSSLKWKTSSSKHPAGQVK